MSWARLYRELGLVARTDPVTGIDNRRHLEERLELDLRVTRRQNASLAVLIIDIDHFKAVNDTFGHQTGDAVLHMVAQQLRATVRGEDSIGRWGGEEFLAVLPFTTLEEAAIPAERLRAAVAARPFVTPSGAPAAVTVSIGYAAGVGMEPEELIRLADGALYAAKQGGRNRANAATAPDRRAVHS